MKYLLLFIAFSIVLNTQSCADMEESRASSSMECAMAGVNWDRCENDEVICYIKNTGGSNQAISCIRK